MQGGQGGGGRAQVWAPEDVARWQQVAGRSFACLRLGCSGHVHITQYQNGEGHLARCDAPARHRHLLFCGGPDAHVHVEGDLPPTADDGPVSAADWAAVMQAISGVSMPWADFVAGWFPVHP